MNMIMRNLVFATALAAGDHCPATSIASKSIEQACSTSDSSCAPADKVNLADFLPGSPPTISQHSIDIALAMFNIKVPENTEHPVLAMELEDRGSTEKNTWTGTARVFIGPEAFSSWAILGSTLAHETEVHCRQSLPIILVLDWLGSDGTELAERQAYEYELDNHARFGLTAGETRFISNTLSLFYADSLTNSTADHQAALSQPQVRQWLIARVLP